MFERKTPIRSTQEDIPELAEEIDRFVVGLAERVDSIQDAELVESFAQVSLLARQLSTDADRLGYPRMAENAKSVAMSAEDGKTDSLQESIIELTDLAQRVRRGHRGAA